MGCFMFLITVIWVSQINASRFSCDFSYIPRVDAWFKLNTMPLKERYAEKKCLAEGGQLLDSIQGPLVTLAVETLMSSKSRHVPAVQIVDLLGSLDTSDEDGEPTLQAIMWYNGTQDISDKTSLPFVCRKDGPNIMKWNKECETYDPEYIYQKSVNSCYKFHRYREYWIDALHMCAAEGGQLAVIDSEDEVKVLTEIFARNPAHTIPGHDWLDAAFIGFKVAKDLRDLHWETIDGQRIDKLPGHRWAPGEPNHVDTNEFCGSIVRNGMIRNDPCTRKLTYICEKRLGQVTQNLCQDRQSIPDHISELKTASLFRCDYTYFTVLEAWFKINTYRGTRNQAEHICRMESARLANPTPPNIQAILYMMKKMNGITALRVQNRANYYSNTNTNTGLPDSELHQILLKNGTLAIADTNTLYPSVCYKKGSEVQKFNEACDNFDENYSYDQRIGHCYKFHREAANWNDARETCRVEGGDLSVINSIAEAGVLKRLFAKNPAWDIPGINRDSAFLGYTASFKMPNRRWTTHYNKTLKEAGYDMWQPGQPDNKDRNEFCGAVNRRGLLRDEDCSQNFPFICEKRDIKKDVNICEDLDRTPAEYNANTKRASRFRCDYTYFDLIGGWIKLHTKFAVPKLAKKTCLFEGAVMASPTYPGLKMAMLALMKDASVPAVHVPKKDYGPKSDDHLVMLDNGSFETVTNTSIYPFLCHVNAEEIKALNKECEMFSDDYTFDKRTGQCYKFHSIAKTWHEGEAVCISEGAYLSVINSAAEAQIIKDIYQLNPRNAISGSWPDTAFMGYISMYDQWHTIAGQSPIRAGYNNWATGGDSIPGPGERCATVGRDGLLHNERCNKMMPYICERPVDLKMHVCDDWQTKYVSQKGKRIL